MMDPAIKTALALCVLLAGACAALLFHRDRPPSVVAEIIADEELLLRYRADASAASTRFGGVDQLAPACREPPTTVATPPYRRESPPSLAPNYPEEHRAAPSRPTMSMAMMLPITAPADGTARVHRIVDGDTLAALAYRYLGSAARADEIYQANRDVLQNPALLPIGLELKIPRQSP